MTTDHTRAWCTWTPETHRGCGWTHDGPGSDKAAATHTRTTTHGTSVETRPVDQHETAEPIVM